MLLGCSGLLCTGVFLLSSGSADSRTVANDAVVPMASDGFAATTSNEASKATPIWPRFRTC